MNILFASRFLPHARARDSGGQDSYHHILWLSRRHQVSLLAFVSPGQEEAVESMRALCRQVVAVPFLEKSLPHRLWRAGWRVLLPRVYGRVHSWTYRRRLQALLAANPGDVVIVDGMMARYGRAMEDTAILLDEVDIYSRVANDIYRQAAPGLRRLLEWADWQRTLRAEMNYARGYDAILARSPEDVRWWQARLPGKAVGLLPPWFEGLGPLQAIPPERPPGNDLLFVGAMAHRKNIEAVITFAEQVLPLIRQQVPDCRLLVVGGNPAPAVRRLARRPEVEVTGEVEDLAPYYRRAALNVVPLTTGGGVIVKTLNGMAAARPTVATAWGVAGIPAEPGRHFLLAGPDPALFAAAVCRLLRDPAQWQALADDGRQFVRQHYDWEAEMARFEVFLTELLPQKRGFTRK